jgi:ABC-type molybdate transport system permease subunit
MQLPDGDASVSRLVIASIVLSLSAVFISEWLSRRYQRVEVHAPRRSLS